ncbi:phospho-N-acetylmuramoyl-pentapeptide-transferase [Paenibacillus sp. MY03]|jgi:phospho-N-acetylmuramoyl-pentapeptide-transferase|uniref:Phospho-N-acetylmuramoyl-pentapeptide-transferase n=1 Tax=Paenibacillus agaridevorans TaxID=171404 RepID=A0A2R5EQV5_9BACL|nr:MULTISPECIES: phospho-N-acetylmuramoyl-pentapeptide-transferase [Paenibacillus]OUS76840.1 phospho-N-acetylmuramoyl-pentapeptide-transferase [Paenibacillus sp. MY03]GBG06153.1 phospho-N-acetylmuramoyl-pentapeptide-transferase [Paenibacillus agaridevorans]
MDMMVNLFAIGVSFLITVLLGPLFIPLLRRLKFGQQIRTEGPESHLKKSGTPTMGGIIIMIALMIAFVRFADKSSEFWVLLTASLGFGLVGFLDDYIKIVFKRSLGLTAWQKLFGQLLFSAIVCVLLYNMGHSTEITIPGTSAGLDLGWFYYLFVVIIMFAASNSVNFTDGLDGLLAGTSAIAFGAFMIVALQTSEHESAIFSAAMIGAVLGFLVYNAHPAKVFMGDMGSLGIGGGIAAVAILTKTELLLIVIGGVFVLEMLSVILQVASFKLRGKRIFKMSPIHHHFELIGWSEWKVVTVFWTVGLLFAAAGILFVI